MRPAVTVTCNGLARYAPTFSSRAHMDKGAPHISSRPLWKRRPTTEAKETYYSGKGDLPERQKRPTIEAKETYYRGKRDILYRPSPGLRAWLYTQKILLCGRCRHTLAATILHRAQVALRVACRIAAACTYIRTFDELTRIHGA